MSRPIHFEFTATDVEQAQAFYKGVFGWQFQKWDGPMPYWLVTTGGGDEPGINGGMSARQPQSFPGTVNTVGVTSIDDTIAAVETHGGKVAAPKMAVPGVGWLAYCTDPEGNVVGLMQMDPAAQ